MSAHWHLVARLCTAAMLIPAVVLGGCSAGGRVGSGTTTSRPAPTTTSTATPTPTSGRGPTTIAPVPKATSVAVYFLRGSYLGVAHRTIAASSAVGSAALSALLSGPAPGEQAAGLSTAVPAGAHLLGLRIADGIAVVNLDSSFAARVSPAGELARVAQVVFTLTQFPTVLRVAFQIDGAAPDPFASGAVSVARPLSRSDVLGALPAILVENPAVGDALHGSLHLTGLAAVFEAQFRVQLVDGTGKVLLDEPVHASAGTGTWGTFDVTFSFTASNSTVSTLRVFDLSQKDGSPIDEVDLHIPAGS
jgi:germination protein M